MNIVAKTPSRLQIYSTSINDNQLNPFEKTSSPTLLSSVKLHQSIYHHSITEVTIHYSSSLLDSSAMTSIDTSKDEHLSNQSFLDLTKTLSDMVFSTSTTEDITSTKTTIDPYPTVGNNQSSTNSPSNSPIAGQTITLIIIIAIIALVIIVVLLLIIHLKRKFRRNKTIQKADRNTKVSKVDSDKKANQKRNNIATKSQETSSKLSVLVNPTATITSK